MPDDVPSARPLAPYLHHRQDARRIRQALTLYLQSQLSPAGHRESVLVDPDVDVPSIPAAVTGVRREYLLAVQEHAAARREYEEVSRKILSSKRDRHDNDNNNNNNNNDNKNNTNDGHGNALDDYLSLQQENRRYAKLQLFDQTLTKLAAQQQNNSIEDVDLDRPSPQHDALLALKQTGDTSRESPETIQSLIANLERSVLRAQANLAREKQLLEEWKARQKRVDSPNANPARRALALQRARDELVQWVEEKLVTANSADGPEFDADLPEEQEEDEASEEHIDQLKDRIREQYAMYVQERSTLLDALALLSQPTQSSAPVAELGKERRDNTETTKSWSSADLFGPATRLLLPGAAMQKSLALQRSYLSGLLSKEKTTIKQSLEKLSHESHLLPEYPMLARQTRFKHIAADDSTERDELVGHAEAWAFAAGAARSHESEYVEQKIAHGQDQSQAALRTVQQIYDMLKVDPPVSRDGGGDEDKDEEDIWAVEAQSRSRGRRRV